MNQNLQYFIDERAAQLAIVHLTRREDLGIERLQTDYGLDMLVTILQDKLPTGRVFGIQVKGQDQAITNRQDFPSVLTRQESGYLQDLPFPVCLFLFTMDDDKGYYKWSKYPVNDLNQASEVIEQNQWYPLDKNQISQILNRVNTWYDTKSHSAA